MVFSKHYLVNSLPFLVVLNTLLSVNQWNKIPLGNTFVLWTINFFLISAFLWHKSNFFKPRSIKNYRLIGLFLVWMLVGVFRGMLIAENYWEWKALIRGFFALSLPFTVYIFSNPSILRKTLNYWFQYAIPLFIIIIFLISNKAYHFYLAPVLLVGCLWPIIVKRKWQMTILLLLGLMITANLDARSQSIKSLVALLLGGGLYFHRLLPKNIWKWSFWLLILIPMILLFLGISGRFNIFEGLSTNKGQYIQKAVVDGEVVEEDLASDTRTFIYVEVINSAILNNYVMWGRTPARGNDSTFFGAHLAEELNTDKYERHSNEVGFLNVFTWLGLIGLILYCCIYIKSAYLAIFKSNSIFLKVIGVFIAFRFAYGWVEDFNRLNIMNIALWMMISIGFSESFRKMNNLDFMVWFNGIFSFNK